jgi:hypothetical protein
VDKTIKLWAFESRQLLASFDVHYPQILAFSPNSRQLAYVTNADYDYKIYICDTPPDVLAQALRPEYAFSFINMYRSCANIPLQKIARTKANLDRLLHVRLSSSHHTTHPLISLQSHATRPLAGQRKPPISTIPIVPRPPPTNDSQQPSFLRLSKFLHFSRTNTVPVRHIQPRNPLDVCRDSISWFFNG